MPTQVDARVLDRKAALDENERQIGAASALLCEAVNKGSAILGEWVESRHKPEGSKELKSSRTSEEAMAELVAIHIFENVLATTDAIQVLLSQACDSAAEPLLRTSFESLIALEYIHQVESLALRRSMAWLVAWQHNRLCAEMWVDPRSWKGKSFRKGEDYPDFAQGGDEEKAAEATHAKRIRDAFDALKSGPLGDLYREFLALDPPRHWHAIDGGPATVQDLARAVGRGSLHDFAYSRWSQLVHGMPIDLNAYGLRSGENIGLVAYVAIILFRYAADVVGSHYLRELDVDDWWATETLPRLAQLRS